MHNYLQSGIMLDSQKTEKNQKNNNSNKFKLTKLSVQIRHEIVYKNLLRDIRKYFSNDFNRQTEFKHMKKRSNLKFENFVNNYIKTQFCSQQL